MGKLLTVMVIATLLVLAFAVPALAAASDPPNAWGQHRAEVNAMLQGSEPVEIDGDMVNNWGHDLLPGIKALGAEMELKNWGKTVQALKVFFSE